MFFTLYQNYPDNFLKIGPYIPNEVEYYEFSQAYGFINSNLSNYSLIRVDLTSGALTENFFGINSDYQVDFNGQFNNDSSHYYDPTCKCIRQVGSNTEVINNKEKLYTLIKNKKICMVLKPHSKSMLLDEESYSYLMNHLTEHAKYEGIQIYCN